MKYFRLRLVSQIRYTQCIIRYICYARIVEVTTKPFFHDIFLTKFFSLDEDFLTQKTNLCLCGVNFWCGVLCGAYFLSVIIFVKKINLRQEKNEKRVLL